MFPGITRAGRHVSRPSGADLVSPYLLSGLAVCAVCGGSLVAMTRLHGTGADRRRVPMYGCVYHQKRGRVVCENDIVIRQDKLDAAFLDALAEAIDDRLLKRALLKAVERLRQRGNDALGQRAALLRERDRTAAGIRRLVEAVMLGRATDTLLSELQSQDAALKTLERRIAEAGGPARGPRQRLKSVHPRRSRGRRISVDAQTRRAARGGCYSGS